MNSNVRIVYTVIGVTLGIALFFDCNAKNNTINNNYSTSNASYKKVNSEVGCYSKYSEDKKKHIFDSLYKNHWMIWKGEVVFVDGNQVSLNMDGVGVQDLIVGLLDENIAYNLVKGDFVTVRFLMKTAGGCFLPFMGDKATIVER